jgi:hypothetical protein
MTAIRVFSFLLLLFVGKGEAASLSGIPLEAEGSESVSVVAKSAFNAWQVKIGSDLTDYRYYVSSTRYFDQVKASISLLSYQDGKYQPVGLLVFFDDNVGSLAKHSLGADKVVGKTICLFFHYSDYSRVLESLQANKAGQVLLGLDSAAPGDASQGRIYGQLLFDPVRNP